MFCGSCVVMPCGRCVYAVYRFSSGLVFGMVSMVGSVVLLGRTLQQTLAQMTSDNPQGANQQTLQVVVSTRAMSGLVCVCGGGGVYVLSLW